MANHRIEIVEADTPARQREVCRLRHRVYVSEMGLLPADHPFVVNNELRDPYDAYSTNLLLLVDGQPAGCVRCTLAMDGPLELSAYRDLDEVCAEPWQAAEFTRFMVLPEHRGSHAAGLLLHAAWRRILAQGARHLLIAGKKGDLLRYYSAFGLRRVGDDWFEYALVGRAQYALLHADFGAPWSARRAIWRAAFEMAYAAVRLWPGAYARLFRRRRKAGSAVADVRPRPERAKQPFPVA